MSNLFLIEGGRTEVQSTDTDNTDNSVLDNLQGRIKDHNSRQQELDWVIIHAQNRGFKNGLLLGTMLGLLLSVIIVLIGAAG